MQGLLLLFAGHATLVYLLKKVKRVTEYPLLMEKLLKQLSADHSGFIVVFFQGMPLLFYPLKPVKRVTECLLLMEKLLKLSSSDHPGFIVVFCRACRSHCTC